MSRVLSELLNAPEPKFTNMLRQLEKESGHPDIDVRLTADIANNVSRKIKELGLDPDDTNGEELYHALQSLIQKHDEFIVAAIGGKDSSDVEDLMPRLIAKAKSMTIPKTCWAVKHSVAKRLIKNSVPKKLMKFLGYRTIDSMLKRENIDTLYAAIRFVESQNWLNKFNASYKSLKPSDFETRRISIISLSDKWSPLSEDFVYQHHHNIVTLKEMGIIAVLPLPVDKLRGVSITVLALIIHYINEVRIYSAYFKHQQVKPNFATSLINALSRDPSIQSIVRDQPLHWRTVQRYFGRQKRRNQRVFEPYVQVEDLTWRSAEDVLYKLEPALKFWEDLDYSAMNYDGLAVPLGLMDNAASYCNQLPFGQQSTRRFRDSLWDEILARYLGQEQIEEQILGQLDSNNDELDLLLADARAK